MDDEQVRDYVAGLPDASGTFTGTFSLDEVRLDLIPIPDLFPVEIDTYDQPNTAAAALPGGSLVITIGDEERVLTIDHVEPLDGNRVRVWCRRPAQVPMFSTNEQDM